MSWPSFRKANPDCERRKLLVHVGMTALDPDLRFDRHKAGMLANRFVLACGVCRLPRLYEVRHPMPCDAAREMQVEPAIGLREAGYGVWRAQSGLAERLAAMDPCRARSTLKLTLKQGLSKWGKLSKASRHGRLAKTSR